MGRRSEECEEIICKWLLCRLNILSKSNFCVQRNICSSAFTLGPLTSRRLSNVQYGSAAKGSGGMAVSDAMAFRKTSSVQVRSPNHSRRHITACIVHSAFELSIEKPHFLLKYFGKDYDFCC